MYLTVGLVAFAGACSAPIQATTEPVKQAGPKPGGVLNVQVTYDPVDWDITYRGTTNAPGLALVYEGLLGFKTPPEASYSDLVVRPRLAERWELSADAKTYTFHLLKGVRFANLPPVNGREVTSSDVKFSYEYMARKGQFKDTKLPTSTIGWQFEGLEAVETPAPSTVVVRFEQPFVPFLNYAAVPLTSVLPREIYDQDGGHFHDHAVGTNAFQVDMTASQKGSRWVFKKNPGYRENGKPYIDEIRWLVIPDQSTAVAAFQTKQVDLLFDVNQPVVAETIAKANPGAVQQKYQRTPVHIYLNLQKPPLDDARIRKAISLSLNREEFSQLFGGGEWDVAGVGAATGILPPEEVKQLQRYDPAEAKRLLTEAGVPNGFTMDYLLNASDQTFIKVFELIQSQAKQVGINFVAKSVADTAEATAANRSGNYFVYASSKLPQVDIDSDLYGVFYSTADMNYGRVKDAKLDQLLVAQRREVDTKKRLDTIREAVRYINGNVLAFALPRVVVFHNWQPWLMGYSPHLSQAGGGTGPRGPLVDAWLDR